MITMESKFFFTLFCLICTLIVAYLRYPYIASVFSVITINDVGISNRKIELEWEKIGGAKAIDIDTRLWKFPYCFLNNIDIACFSLNPEKGNFYSINKRKVIMIQMNSKTYQNLYQYGKGKSEVIDRFLDSVDWYKYR